MDIVSIEGNPWKNLECYLLPSREITDVKIDPVPDSEQTLIKVEATTPCNYNNNLYKCTHMQIQFMEFRDKRMCTPGDMNQIPVQVDSINIPA